ncbi:MAG: GNAT family N-acetyltransferase [Bryobacteraceae bacterium]
MNKIRLLRNSDIGHLLELSTEAGWNQTAEDWQRLLTLAPDGCFGIESGGKVVSSTTVIRYGAELAWIGMVLTHSSNRGRGNAGALMKHALAYARSHGVGWAKLDATADGHPIYSKLGFEDECAVERWKRPSSAAAVTSPRPLTTYVLDPSFDRAYFVAARQPLLSALIAERDGALVPGFGYAMGRPGAVAAYFGPSVVRTREAARLLLQWFLAHNPAQDVFWDLFPDNPDAVQLAIDHGFQPARALTRMALRCRPDAPLLRRHNAGILAIAGFEYG